MNQYEFIFLLKEKKEREKIEGLVSSLKGKILEKEEWGEKTLAYPIKKEKTAFFFVWQISLERKKLTELKKKLNFNEKILRYLFLKPDKTIQLRSNKKLKKSP